MTSEKQLLLTPDWRSWFWFYLAGFVLIPLFGAGLIFLWIIHRWRTSIRYEIRDRSIRRIDRKGTFEMELFRIDDTSVSQTWIEKRFETGTVVLQGDGVRLELHGIENPQSMADTIEVAAEAARQDLYPIRRAERREPEYEPGTLEQMDYLTGLWHEGLLSDEDYRKEKRHFE